MTSDIIAARAVDAVFTRLGVSGKWWPASDTSGTGTDVRLIPVRPTEDTTVFDRPVRVDTDLFEVRVSEIAAPTKGLQVLYAGARYAVQAKPKHNDPARLTWLLECAPVAS